MLIPCNNNHVHSQTFLRVRGLISSPVGLRIELIQLGDLGSAISSPHGVQGEAPAATQNMKVFHFPDEMDEPKLRGGQFDQTPQTLPPGCGHENTQKHNEHSDVIEGYRSELPAQLVGLLLISLIML